MFDSIDLKEVSEAVWGAIIFYGPKLILAVLVLIIGLWLTKRVKKFVKRTVVAKNIDITLQPFIISLVDMLLKVLLAISVMTTIGIAMTSFVAILGAAGLAIGLALSGTLQNFAGGVVILILKPFKVGDFISAGSNSGTVKAIYIFHTYMRTVQNINIIIPNGQLSNETITNYSLEETRRLDIVFGISYTDDIIMAKKVIQRVIEEDIRILTDPEPYIAVSELADSSVNIQTRMWITLPEFWNVNKDIHEKMKKELEAAGISIPFPQRDVHLYQEKVAQA